MTEPAGSTMRRCRPWPARCKCLPPCCSHAQWARREIQLQHRSKGDSTW